MLQKEIAGPNVLSQIFWETSDMTINNYDIGDMRGS